MIPYGTKVPVAARLVANCYTSSTFTFYWSTEPDWLCYEVSSVKHAEVFEVHVTRCVCLSVCQSQAGIVSKRR